MRTALLFLVLLPSGLAAADLPPVDEILRRLAESQGRAVAARNSVVYRQSTFSRLLRGGSRIAREEKREYVVTPNEKGTSKERVRFEGRYEKGGKLHAYSDPEFRHKKMDLDGELIEEFTDDMVDNKESRDGLDRDIFPFTRDEQVHYDFQLAGTRKVKGVDAMVLKFAPKKRAKGEEGGRPWRGEVLVHPEEFQPLMVTTELGNVIPGWVKVVFGIDIKQYGYNLTYTKVADGLWFPATYGTEFGLRIFFGYGRTITLSMENTDFRIGKAESTITYETAENAAPDGNR